MKKKGGILRALSLKTHKPARPQRSVPSRNSTPRQTESASVDPTPTDEELWHLHMATLRRAAEDLAHRRSTAGFRLRSTADHFDRLTTWLIDCTDTQRPSTIKQLYNLDPERAASFLNTLLQAGTADDRRQIGAALEASGLVNEAITDLTGHSHSHSYRAFSLLFLVAKAGTVGPLIRVIEDHPNIELRLALIRLLASSGAPDLVRQFQRLRANKSMPAELCNAMNESVIQIGGHASDVAPSAA
jgi:hypothetical protein